MPRIYRVEPLAGIGPARLGMDRQEVRAALGLPFDSFVKSPTDEHPADAFHDSAFQIFYSGATPRVEFIELSKSRDYKVFYKEIEVFKTPAAELVELIARDAPYDVYEPEMPYTYTFPALSLSLWREAIPETPRSRYGRYFDTIGVAVKGYWDR